MIFKNEGRIGVKSLIVITAIIIIIAVIGMLIINENKKQPTTNIPITNNNTPATSGEYTPNSVDINTLPPDSTLRYHGLWVDMVMGGQNYSGDDLWIYARNENSIDIEYIGNNGISFEAYGIPIIDGRGEFVDSSRKYNGSLNLKTTFVELDYTEDETGSSHSISFEKLSKKTVTRRELFGEIQRIINSNYQNIDPTIFRIKNGKEFLLLNMVPTCYVENRERKSTYNGIDYFRDVYTIDKVSNKLVSISDVIPDEKHVKDTDAYIKDFLNRKKAQAELSGDTWNYADTFLGILSPYNIYSKYFYVDEENYTVSIQIYDDLWCNVPFYIAFDKDRQSRYGVSAPIVLLPSGDTSGDISGDLGGINNVVDNEV